MTTSLAQWSAIVAFFVPVALAVLNQSHWASQVKAAIFFGVSLIAAAGTAYFAGDLTGKTWLDSSLIIVPAAAAFYHGFWKPTNIAPAIEEATNVSGLPSP